MKFLKKIKTKLLVPWTPFFKVNIVKILNDKKNVLDIGGSLRISLEKGNRVNPDMKWVADIIKKNGIDYKIMDVVPDYNPDIVGDIHNMPFADNSLEAIICIAVLEHIENPIKACQEIYRTLKPGGYAMVQAPFLFYYHPEKGYYNDYWRFTPDSLKMLFKDFSHFEMHNIRGSFGAWIHLSPFGRMKFSIIIANLVDKIFGKLKSNQTSGFTVFLVK